MPESSPLHLDDAFVADPYSHWAELRRTGPVHRAVAPDGAAIWLVTSYDAAASCATDPHLSVDRTHAAPDGYRGFALPPALDRNLLNIDGPDHTRLRSLVAKGLSRKRLSVLRPRIYSLAEAMAEDVASALQGNTPLDLISTYAAPLPITVIAELLGIPSADRADFRAWTDRMLDPPTSADVSAAINELYDFLSTLIVNKRSSPGDDLITDLISARDGDDMLTDDELLSSVFLVLFAGYENVTHVIGNGLAHLLTRPGGLVALTSEDGGLAVSLDALVDELLRYDPPPQVSIRRFVTNPGITVAGHNLPPGDTVMLSWASANRDRSIFADPDELHIDREERTSHLTFGRGPHACLGAALARTELAAAFSALIRRLPDLALDIDRDELDWRPSFRNRGLRRLPVRITSHDGVGR